MSVYWFFFFKQKTAYELRISDWSSDVGSSDLRLGADDRAKYQDAMSANGLPWQAFEMFNPWMAGMALSVKPLEALGYKSDLGAEKVLTAAARADRKSTRLNSSH